MKTKYDEKLEEVVRKRFLQGRREVLAATSEISEEEIAELVETAVTNSRRERANKDKPPANRSR